MKNTPINPPAREFANTESEIISRILAGEKSFFEILIRRYNGGLYKIGRSYGFSHDAVQDLMQETHISAYQNLAKFEQRASYKTWLYRIMLNKCYHASHAKAHTNHTSFSEMMDTDPEAMNRLLPATSSHREVLNHELGQVLEKCIEELPLDYRTVFILREIEGLTIREAAETISITEANVKVRLTRAKAMLRRQIEAWYPRAAIYEFNLIYCDRIVERVLQQI